MGQKSSMIYDGPYQTPNHMLSCFDVFLRINSLSSANFKYVKTQFYNKVYSNVVSSSSTLEDSSRSSIRSQKHRYEKVSTPVSCARIPKFQQKGLIVVWPQRKKFRNWETLTLISWLVAHAMYLLYITNILPSASVVAISKPPWNCKKKVLKPFRRDYIIEPDWDSQYL